MAIGRICSHLLTVAVILAAVTATYSVMANAAPGKSSPDPRQDSSDLPIPGPTPTPPPSEFESREEALGAVAARFPELAAAIMAVEAEDVEGILAALRWRGFECTPDDHRGGIAPRCSELGVRQGTSVPMFHYELLAASHFTREQMRERVQQYLLRRGPKLGLVATHPDGRWLVTFTVDEGDQEGLRGIDFRADREGTAPFTSHKERFSASTPLDTIREDDRDELMWKVLYASESLLAWEAEKDRMHRDEHD
jgi:hypothetical protein